MELISGSSNHQAMLFTYVALFFVELLRGKEKKILATKII